MEEMEYGIMSAQAEEELNPNESESELLSKKHLRTAGRLIE